MADVVKTRRGLSTELVVDAALRMADEDGLEAVSLPVAALCTAGDRIFA
jgi:hypothetical protein